MQLPRRERGDELLAPGEMIDIRRRLRAVAGRHDLATVIACAFDHRTRMLPFIFADLRMVPAGVRAIGSAMSDSGFNKTRIVLQQWNRRFDPSQMRLDGRVPDLFMVSSMGLHLDPCMKMIRQAHTIAPDDRPLIIAGGPQCMYQPWELFSNDPTRLGADVAVTGEAYVLLNLLEIVLAHRGRDESMRTAFLRARDDGALDAAPGLMYGLGDAPGVAEQLIDTGIQRLVGDLDELPSPVPGYAMLEAPSRAHTLSSAPLSVSRVRKLSPIASIVMTLGCKFACPYCPIPGYNQRQYRMKSGDRIARDMAELNDAYGLRYFFGADDNFFNDADRTMGIVDTLTRTEHHGKSLARTIRWHTEVTVHDTLKMREHLPAIRESGCRALWLGVEDLTGSLVNKGQGADNTTLAFNLLRDAGICPMPMMMHHDQQPLRSRGTDYGLLNQVRLLRQAGAASLQVLMITPSAGSKLYEQTFENGGVYDRVGGRKVEPHMYDGNYVIASRSAEPWRKQLNLLASYAYFYNPLQLLRLMLGPRTKTRSKSVYMQIFGMLGLLHTIRRTLGWMARLRFGKIEKLPGPPTCDIPIRGADGNAPGHAPTPLPAPLQIVVNARKTPAAAESVQ